MKSENIVKKLQKEGYKIVYKKWGYWDGVPYVQLDGFGFTIAEHVQNDGWLGINLDFIFNHVQQALYVAQKNNPIFLKKIKESPAQSWYYSRYLIQNMQDYYDYVKGVYPFDEYYQILKKLKSGV